MINCFSDQCVDVTTWVELLGMWANPLLRRAWLWFAQRDLFLTLRWKKIKFKSSCPSLSPNEPSYIFNLSFTFIVAHIICIYFVFNGLYVCIYICSIHYDVLVCPEESNFSLFLMRRELVSSCFQGGFRAIMYIKAKSYTLY